MWITIFDINVADCEQCSNAIYFVCYAEILQKQFSKTWWAGRNCICRSWAREWNWYFKQLDGIIKTNFLDQVTGMGVLLHTVVISYVLKCSYILCGAFLGPKFLVKCILLIGYWCLFTLFIFPLVMDPKDSIKACTTLATTMKFGLIEIFCCKIEWSFNIRGLQSTDALDGLGQIKAWHLPSQVKAWIFCVHRWQKWLNQFQIILFSGWYVVFLPLFC